LQINPIAFPCGRNELARTDSLQIQVLELFRHGRATWRTQLKKMSSSWRSRLESFTVGIAVAAVVSVSWSFLSSRLSRGKHSKNSQQILSTLSRVTAVASLTQDNPEQTPEEDHILGHRRLRKAETVLQLRTSRIILVVEKSHDDHNQMAILRTAEALGIGNIWVIESAKMKEKKVSVAIARTSVQWVEMRSFDTTEECILELRKQGREIWVTDLSQEAECLELGSVQVPSSPGIALVVGNESRGVSEEMLKAADKRIYLPLFGWADSLNLSVATALVLQRLIDCSPDVIGDISEAEKSELRKKWYIQLAGTPDQERLFTEWVQQDRIAVPFGDLRRPNSHRDSSWVRKKVVKKVQKAEQERLARKGSN
jgi:tRNA G18 (ribose-2'-O)-methylase SpoU